MKTDDRQIGSGYHMMAKPMGPLCNLDCEYCFYSEKKSFLRKENYYRMSDEVLEAFISKYISSQDIPEIQFVWQGGEPSLAGLDFFERVVQIQAKYANGKSIVNALQTNGTLLNDQWCTFLKKNGFLVGLSIDGPELYHDRYRVDHSGKPTLSKVLTALNLLKKYDIPYNALVCVTRETSKHPLEIYNFLKSLEIEYIQFTPIVERVPNDSQLKQGLKHAAPPIYDEELDVTLSPYSVEPAVYGDFLIQIFEQWVRTDVGSVFVVNFEWALESWLGLPSTICIFAKQCGSALALEHNGDIYSCDHYVYPDYLLGNVLKEDPKKMIASDQQQNFGANKSTSLPKKCHNCEALFACNGECPRHRFLTTPSGEPGLNYLCEGYYKYFRHIHRYMKVMVQLIEQGQPASKVMDVVKDPLVIIKEKS
ncbi:anaerobic sulfatase maturase [Vibrio sp. WJH972]